MGTKCYTFKMVGYASMEFRGLVGMQKDDVLMIWEASNADGSQV